MTCTAPATVAAVAIGRNEGARLRHCLDSLTAQVGRIVYVDSGSEDDSVAIARGMGVEVVVLDPATPFTAARARNAGFAALEAAGLPDFVQFVDGDCGVVAGWIAAGVQALEADPDLAVVTGWRAEVDRQASVYNAMCDVEWRRPAGPIIACGGDMMVRARVFAGLGGFDPQVIAAEDDEFCLRVAKAGHRLERLPLEMTRHDAAMTRFLQWWRRSVRNGHGFAQVGALHPEHLRRERLRAWVYGAALPGAALAGLVLWRPLLILVAVVYALSWLRTARGLAPAGQQWPEAAHHALFLTLSKFPNLLGMLTFYLRRALGRANRIIEYK